VRLQGSLSSKSDPVDGPVDCYQVGFGSCLAAEDLGSVDTVLNGFDEWAWETRVSREALSVEQQRSGALPARCREDWG